MLSTPGGRPASAAIWPNSQAVAGVSSAAFSTAVLPQMMAGNTFQATLAMGVLAAMIRPATPMGQRTVIACLPMPALVVVRPNRRMPSPAMNWACAMAPPTSPMASLNDLPVSAATTAAMSFWRAFMAAAMSNRMSPRLTAGMSAQAGWAARATATARSITAASDRTPRHSRRPSAGANLSKVAWVRLCSPAIQLGMISGIREEIMSDHHADQPPSTTRLLPVM